MITAKNPWTRRIQIKSLNNTLAVLSKEWVDRPWNEQLKKLITKLAQNFLTKYSTPPGITFAVVLEKNNLDVIFKGIKIVD
jgi:hypothetical protein